jgi:hypothetical protein
MAMKKQARKAAPRPQKKAGKAALKPEQANLFELRRARTSITYTSTSITGQPQLNFDDGKRKLTFSGRQIQQSSSMAGDILTVPLKLIADAGGEALTVLIPRVNVQEGEPAKIKTVVIFTEIRGSFGGPALLEGQIQTYTAQTFRGTARFVIS